MVRTFVRPGAQVETRFYAGLDLGQKQDYTALAVVERRERETGEVCRVTYEREREVGYGLLHLARAPLGTPYPKIVEWVRGVVEGPELAGACRLVVDETGVGAPVVDLLRAAQPGCGMTAVTITGGGQAEESGGRARVPKRDLILGLQVMLDQGELKIAEGLAGTAEFVKELMSMRVRVSESGHDAYGPVGRSGRNDDLVLAVGLACWKARGKRWEMFGRRNIGIYG